MHDDGSSCWEDGDFSTCAVPGVLAVLSYLDIPRSGVPRNGTLAWQGHGWQQGGKEPTVLCIEGLWSMEEGTGGSCLSPAAPAGGDSLLASPLNCPFVVLGLCVDASFALLM